MLIIHRFTYPKGVHSYRYFLPSNSYVMCSCIYAFCLPGTRQYASPDLVYALDRGSTWISIRLLEVEACELINTLLICKLVIQLTYINIIYLRLYPSTIAYFQVWILCWFTLVIPFWVDISQWDGVCQKMTTGTIWLWLHGELASGLSQLLLSLRKNSFWLYSMFSRKLCMALLQTLIDVNQSLIEH